MGNYASKDGATKEEEMAIPASSRKGQNDNSAVRSVVDTSSLTSPSIEGSSENAIPTVFKWVRCDLSRVFPPYIEVVF